MTRVRYFFYFYEVLGVWFERFKNELVKYTSLVEKLQAAHHHISPLAALLFLFPRDIASPLARALKRVALMLALSAGITTRSYARLATSPSEV